MTFPFDHISFRPVVILLCGMLLFNLPIFLYKVRLFMNSVLYICFCYDKSYSKPKTDPSTYFQSNSTGTADTGSSGIRRKTIYFVRHGESTWNDTFNKGKHRSVLVFILGFVPNLIRAILYELYLLLSGKMDSWFYDAPLSILGLQQVNDLASFLKSTSSNTPMAIPKSQPSSSSSSSSTTRLSEEAYQRHLTILRSDMGAPKSKLMASNLRRAVSTIIGGFQDRWHQRHSNHHDKILIVPCLQEISSNPDTLCITPPHTTIQASWLEQQQQQQQSMSSLSSTKVQCNYPHWYKTQTDMSLHTGNKPVFSNGYQRMMEFCHFLFAKSSSIPEDYIIVGGHSLWFRSFFRLLLPYHVAHVAKEKKIVNGGIVVFDLCMTVDPSGTPRYMIDPASIQTIYGGF